MAKPMLKRVGRTKCVNCDEAVAVKETSRGYVRYDCEFCGHSEAARDAAGDARCRARWGIGSDTPAPKPAAPTKPAQAPKPVASSKQPAPTPPPAPAKKPSGLFFD